MVRIINYQQRQAEDGKLFFVLEIQGGIEMVKSKESGKFYVTARKASIPSTFDELTCKTLVGTELPGAIEKVACEPYDYTIPDSGETISLSHRFEYVEQEKAITQKVEKSNVTIDSFMENIPSGHSFSTNGALAH